MTFAYVFRLFCLCLACFFLIHFVLAIAISLVAPVAVRAAERMHVRSAARFVLFLRWTPAVFAVLTVAILCVPSYLRLEPHEIAEPIGLACLAAASLGLSICAGSFLRATCAVRNSHRYLRACRRSGRQIWLLNSCAPVLVLDTAERCFSLAGLFRPKLVISSEILSAFSAAQLDVALRHEHVHRTSRDNLKRLLLILAPRILPFIYGCEVLDRAWARFAEWSADDSAIAGGGERSICLAETLVGLARLPAATTAPELAASLLSDSSDLALRVERLLNSGSVDEKPVSRVPIVITNLAVFLLATAIGLFGLFARTAGLLSVHAALEHLIR